MKGNDPCLDACHDWEPDGAPRNGAAKGIYSTR
jgi:hypothetical protein